MLARFRCLENLKFSSICKWQVKFVFQASRISNEWLQFNTISKTIQTMTYLVNRSALLSKAFSIYIFLSLAILPQIINKKRNESLNTIANGNWTIYKKCVCVCVSISTDVKRSIWNVKNNPSTVEWTNWEQWVTLAMTKNYHEFMRCAWWSFCLFDRISLGERVMQLNIGEEIHQPHRVSLILSFTILTMIEANA